MSVDLANLPDLVCGQTYRDPRSEARLPAMRAGETSPFTGCGKPMVWLIAYRCRTCARWLHGTCMDRHFDERAATPSPGQEDDQRE